ncbi:MAG: DUF885 domain-containing protein [Sphingomonadaceae bacterium]
MPRLRPLPQSLSHIALLAAVFALPVTGATARTSGATPGTGPASTPASTSASGQETGDESTSPSLMHDMLFALFAWNDEQEMKLNPVEAMYRGDMRYADRLGDYLSDEYYTDTYKLAEDTLTTLGEIDRDALFPEDQIAYDVFAYNQEKILKENSPEILALTAVTPIDHFTGVHTFYPTFASDQGPLPYKTIRDYENGLSRNADYIAYIDRAIMRFREGMGSGVLSTQLTIGNVIAQLDTQLAMPVEESPYWGPVAAIPDSFSDADRTRLTNAYRSSIASIYAANTRLRDFLKNDYYPVARTSVGLVDMKGGQELYAWKIEDNTTLPLSAEEIHATGLSEVSRIRGEMERVRQEVGFDGTLHEFFEYLRTDPKFKPESREALTRAYYAIGKEVDGKIGDYFNHTPKAKLEIRPYPEFREKFEAGGSYEPGSADGSRPGVFYFNAYDLPSRTTPGETTLYLHEGAPGHHYQISLAQENESLPAFMRFGGNTAYVEGWALYAETLGYPMGFYKDPYQRFGTLDDEMLRAMRLVVDTGIHAKGWSRDQAIEYMLDNSGMGRTDATAEVERYIAMPGQALAYKTGAMTIQRLRQKAENALGDSFDIRAFHDQVLGTGSLPLPGLESKIDSWIKRAQGN